MWKGELLKQEIKKHGFSQSIFAKEVGVSKTAVSEWIKGGMPKGENLLRICNILQVTPDHFFGNNVPEISIPVHRKKLAGKITGDSKELSLEIASDYLNLFRSSKPPALDCNIRNVTDNKEEQLLLANEMRLLSGVQGDSPVRYEDVFALLAKLNIIPIFKYFPEAVKAYAFQTNISGHRIIFIDVRTNTIDLIFVVLHETIHSLVYKSESFQTAHYGDLEEEFCDNVASYIQFPPTYIDHIIKNLKGKSGPEKVFLIKQFAHQNFHATYGVSKIIRQHSKILNSITPSVFAGADTNIRKRMPSLIDILYETDDPRGYVAILKKLSPVFVQLVKREIDNVSQRKIAEWLDLDDIGDARQAIEELRRL